MIRQSSLTKIRNLAQGNKLTFDAYYHLGSVYHRARLKFEDLFKESPLIVYQMGKVGSGTVYSSLKAMKLARPIYHVHFLAPDGLDMIRDSHRRRLESGVLEVDPATITCEYLARRIAQAPGKRWDVVTLIREPISRSISAFFQNVYRWIPDFHKKCENRTIDYQELNDEFFSRKNILHYSLNWLDIELKRVFGVDVYESFFDWERGYQIYEGEKARVLLIRLEDINKAPQAFNEFLSLENFKLFKSNEASDKVYSEIYKNFSQQLELPGNYLNQIFDAKFTRHFYSPAEIERIRARWIREPQA